MLYKRFIHPVLHRINSDNAYTFALAVLHTFRKLFVFRTLFNLFFKSDYPTLNKENSGINFPNPIGLASGLDKNAVYYNDLAACGFGFVEIGTITPKTVLSVIKNLKKNNPEVIIAADIAHDSNNNEYKLVKDYETLVSLLYDFVDFFIINAASAESSHRSPLEDPDVMADVLDAVLDKRINMDKLKPLMIKISTEIPTAQLVEILNFSLKSGVDGIVVKSDSFEKSKSLISLINKQTKGRLTVIASGCVQSPEEAEEILACGASMLELMNGFACEGPKLVKKILKQLDKPANYA